MIAMQKQKKLSLCIIAKDEDSYSLECLKNMEDVAEEIILVDLGSGSRILESAKLNGVIVYHADWEEDFSKIKNFCMDCATGDWVLFLQANETISRDQFDELRILMMNPAAEGYFLNVDESRKRQLEACPTQSLRLIRNRKNYRFYYRSYEYIPEEELYSLLSCTIKIVRDEQIADWQTEERIRLLNMDLKEHPHDSYVRYLQGIELLNQEKYKESAAAFELARHALYGGYFYARHLYKCLANCLIVLARYDVAEEVLKEGIWMFPYYTDLLVLRATMYHQLDRIDEALNTLDICLMLRNAPDTCLLTPQIDFETIKKMRKEIQASQKCD